MKPWSHDAMVIGNIDSLNPEEDLVITYAIRQFVEAQRDTMFFVVGPKGFGKTLLLMYKRLLYQQKHRSDEGQEDICFIPKDNPLDRTDEFMGFSIEKNTFLEKSENWNKIWFFCIAASAIKHVKRIYEKKGEKELLLEFREMLDQLDPQIKSTFEITNLNTPCEYLNYVLDGSISRILAMIMKNHRILNGALRSIHYSVVVFIDNVDQALREHVTAYGKSGTSADSIIGVLSPEIWYAAQIGLIKAVWTLSSICRHLRVFASIRKEAFSRFSETDEMALQMLGSTLDLDYDKNELKIMFQKNIRRMKKDYKDALIHPHEEDDFYAFLGLKENKITNVKVANLKEDVFDYIYRHTLKRPRDLMVIGRKLTDIAPENRDEERIRDAVDEASVDIAKEYITETIHHTNLTIPDFENLAGLIDSNILTKDGVEDICAKFNGLQECGVDECSQCMRTNPFCNLYRLGLIGILRENVDGRIVQEFLPPGSGDVNPHESEKLPISDYYLLHPILYTRIYDIQKKLAKPIIYKTNVRTIVGDRRHWFDPKIYERDRYCSFIDKICKKETYLNPDGLFLASSNDRKDIIKKIAEKLREGNPHLYIESWTDRVEPETGEIFCDEVCPRIYQNDTIVGEIGDFNPNVLFECGFGIGLGRRIILTCEDNETTRSAVGQLYTTHYEVVKSAAKMSELKVLQSLYTTPRFLKYIENFGSPSNRRKKDHVYVLTYNAEQEIMKKLEEYKYKIVKPTELAGSLMPRGLIQKLIDAKAVLVNLSGKQKDLNLNKINDSKMLCLAGICVSQGVPTKLFARDEEYYSDIRELRLPYSVEAILDYVNGLSKAPASS